MKKNLEQLIPAENMTYEKQLLFNSKNLIDETTDYAGMLEVKSILKEMFHSRAARNDGSYKSETKTLLIKIESRIRRYEMEESSEKNEKIGIKEIIKNKIGI